jgi:hypothetical protein
LKRPQTALPCDFNSHEPSSESATRIASVGRIPIASHLVDHVQLRQRDDDEDGDERQQRHVLRLLR